MSMGVHPCSQGRSQVLGGDTITLQKLESTIFPPKGVFTFCSQMTPEESDFLDVSRSCQQEAGALRLTPEPSPTLGQTGATPYFSTKDIPPEPTHLDPLGYPIPPPPQPCCHVVPSELAESGSLTQGSRQGARPVQVMA